MKKHLFICLSLVATLSGCSTDEEVSRSQFKALSFETFVGKGTTRALPKTAFADGDDFGVIAYTHGTTPWADGIEKQLFMSNVKVSMQNGAWTYSPIQYWEEGVKHTFLAYSPYNASYVLDPDGKLAGIITAEKASQQTDVLYSIPEAGSKDLEWAEGKKVVMTFRHALSQIKISASTDQDYSGYYTARVRKVRLLGIGNTGFLNLSAADAATSPWSGQGSSVAEGYAATTDALDIPLTTTETLLNAGNNLFMQIPQTIVNNGTMNFEITYDVEATTAGNAANAGTGNVTLIKIPAITWEHNYIYHYKIQMDLQQLLNLKPIELGDPDVVEWEAGGDTKLPEDLTVVIEPTSTGDSPQTGTGNATLGITKGYEGGETQTVNITNPEKDDQWIVEVGPEITTTATRATNEPATWLKVCKEGESNEASKLYGKDDATILIKITEQNTSAAQRKAEVTIRRALSGVTRIIVTQEKAPAAIIEANSTQFPMEGGTNQLTIINPASAAWTLSQTDGTASWLSLVDAAGNAVTSGTAGQVVQAVALPNHTTAVRRATITLTREGQDPVLVEVTQAAPQPMTVSANSFPFTYSGGSQTLTIANPEGGKDGFQWTLEGTAPSWLAVSPTTGTTARDKVTFTATTNTAASARTSGFTLKRVGQADIPITVSQAAAPATTLSPTTLSLDYLAQSASFNVSGPSGIPWTLSSTASWLTLSPASGSGNTRIVCTVTANSSTTDARYAVVTLTRAGQNNVTLVVTQNKAPVPEITVTPKIHYRNGTNVDGYPFYYTVNAPEGVKWVATITDTRYGLYPYLYFVVNGGKAKRAEGTGTAQLLMAAIGFPPSTRGYTGLFEVTPEGGQPYQAGMIINP